MPGAGRAMPGACRKQLPGAVGASLRPHWMFAQSQYYLGEHAAARGQYPADARGVFRWAMRGGGPDPFMARILLTCAPLLSVGEPCGRWGLADQAVLAARGGDSRKRGSVNHPVSLCIALAAPSSISFLVEDGISLEGGGKRSIDEFDRSPRRSTLLTPYQCIWALCSKGGLFGGCVAIWWRPNDCWRRRDPAFARSVRLLSFPCLLPGASWPPYWGAAWAASRRGLVEIDAALDYAETSWNRSGACRNSCGIKGAFAGEAWRCRSRRRGSMVSCDPADLAHRQGGVGRWELRAATSLARLWLDGGRRVRGASKLLGGVYQRFTGGFRHSGSAKLRRGLPETNCLDLRYAKVPHVRGTSFA